MLLAAASALALAAAPAASPPPGERVVPQIAHLSHVLQIAWAPDGSFVATTGRDGAAKLWTPDGRLLRTVAAPALIPRVAIAPDGKTFLLGGSAGVGQLELRSTLGRRLRTISAPVKPLLGWRDFAFGPDGSWFVGCAQAFDRDACAVYDLAGNALATLALPPDAKGTVAVAVSPDGETLYTAGGRALIAWGRDGALRWRADAGPGSICAMALSPDGERLATATAAPQELPGRRSVEKPPAPALRLWDAAGRRLAGVPWHESGSLSFSRDGTRLVSGGAKDGHVLLADRDGRILSRLKLGGTGRASPAQAALSPDGTTLLVSAETDRPATPRVHDLEGRTVGRFAGAGSGLISVALDPTGRLVVTTSSDGQVRFFQLDGRLVRRFPAQDDYPNVLAVDPRGRYVVTGSRDLVAFDGKGKVLARGRAGRGYARALAFAPDARTLYVGGSSGVVTAIPLAPGAKPATLRAFQGGDVDALAIDPSGKLLAAAGDSGDLRLLDTAGRVRASVTREKGKRGTVLGLAFTPAGDELVVSSSVRGAELEVYALDGTLRRSAAVRNGFISGGFALSPSGRLAAVTMNAEIGLYDPGTMAPVRTLKGHRDDVVSLAFTADERHLVSGSQDGTVRIWRVETGDSAALFAAGDAWTLHTDDGYFDGSRRAGDLLAIVDGMQAFGLDQVALRLNRPELIYQRLGIGDEPYLEHLRARHRERVAQSGAVEDASLAAAVDAPAVRIVSSRRDGDAVELELEAEDAGEALASVQLWANGVPLLGPGGRAAEGRSARLRERVELAQGRNRIEAGATNRAGLESRKATLLADRKATGPGALWFVGLGVSRYRDASLDLRLAHRDVQLLDGALRKAKGRFAAVRSLVLTDAEVTRGALERIAAFLAPAAVDDTVVVLASGHGARDPGASATFYFATHEADRAALPATTIALDELDGVLGAVKARRRLLLLDACQSGDLDPAALEAAKAQAAASGLTVRLAAGDGPAAPAPRTYLAFRDRYVYARLERRTGTVVFASSLGHEVSLENPALGSGVFTAAILRALGAREVDRDRDGWISLDELEPAVKVLVSEVTRGIQHPTIERENPLQDLRLPLLR